MSTSQANWDNAKQQYPSTTDLTPKDWVAYFDRNPEVMSKILGDIYVITKAHQSETKRSGRRPRHINGSLDELWGMITPTYSTEPFGPALRDVMNGTSIRAFAAKIPMHHSLLIRLMNGERNIVNPYDIPGTMRTLETIAKAGKVHPTYFSEYRTLYIFSMFTELFAAKPNFTITLSKRLNDIEFGS